jgi:hypothetical protein
VIEPVELQDLLITVFAGAMVILCGGLYALLFACSRVYRAPRLMPLAYGAYVLLVVFVVLLAEATHLTGFWQWLVYIMLVGYLLAPHGIWHLCEGTHRIELAGVEPPTDSFPTQNGGSKS